MIVYEIEVWPVGYCFKTGHRIRLEISNADSPITDTIHYGPAHPSRLLLPMTPSGD